jgi:hypothetical protein
MARLGRAIWRASVFAIKRFASEHDPLLLFRCGSGGSFVGVFLLEAFDAAGCVNKLLLAGEEWVALRADFNADQLAFGGGAGLKRASAGAVDRDRVIIGVNSFFHERLLFGWPVCVTTAASITVTSLGQRRNLNYTT